MIIDKIRALIISWMKGGITPDTIIVSKDIERSMYLDDSFPKSENFVNTINVDNRTFDFIVIDGTGLLKVCKSLY